MITCYKCSCCKARIYFDTEIKETIDMAKSQIRYHHLMENSSLFGNKYNSQKRIGIHSFVGDDE